MPSDNNNAAKPVRRSRASVNKWLAKPYTIGGAEPAAPVDRSREIAGQYMVATELINPLIERAEKAFAALRLGVSASVKLYDSEDEGWSDLLCFEKLGNEWALVQSEGHCSDPSSWKSTRLTATSRATRLRALSLLPSLEKALIDQAELEANQAATTVARAEAYLTALEARTK